MSHLPAMSRIWNSRKQRCARADAHARAAPLQAASFAAGHRAPGPRSFDLVLARWSAHGRECRFSFSFVPAAGAWGALRKNQLHRRQRLEAAASGRATRAGGEHSAAAKPRRRRHSQKGAAAAGPAARRRWSQLARVRGMMEGVPRGCPLRLTLAAGKKCTGPESCCSLCCSPARATAAPSSLRSAPTRDR